VNAAAFEAIDLQPLAALDARDAAGPTGQSTIVSALCGTEAASEPTNVLGPECASGLRREPCSTAPTVRVRSPSATVGHSTGSPG